jgi:hypothetical protein
MFALLRMTIQRARGAKTNGKLGHSRRCHPERSEGSLHKPVDQQFIHVGIRFDCEISAPANRDPGDSRIPALSS